MHQKMKWIVGMMRTDEKTKGIIFQENKFLRLCGGNYRYKIQERIPILPIPPLCREIPPIRSSVGEILSNELICI